MAKNYNAKQVYQNLIIYKNYIIENNLEDDSKTIKVTELMDFVENEVTKEDKKHLVNFVN